MNEQFLNLIKEVVPAFSKEDLYLPVRDANIDSLDLVVIRVALEKHFGFEISDIEWYQFQTLTEALTFFHKQSNRVEKKNSSFYKYFFI